MSSWIISPFKANNVALCKYFLAARRFIEALMGNQELRPRKAADAALQS